MEVFVTFAYCRKNYKGYLLESRLHFRIHAIRLQLDSMEGSQASDGGITPQEEDSGAFSVSDMDSNTVALGELDLQNNTEDGPAMSTKL